MLANFSKIELPERMPRRLEQGQIHLISGPMFSGKTTELFRLCNRFSLAKRKILVVKYARDNRYGDLLLSTHDLRKMDALSAVRLSDVWAKMESHDVIGIDEGTFEDVFEVAERLADLGKMVIIAALNADYKREPFAVVSRLFAVADKVEKLNAVCRFCGDEAPFTLRTVRCEKREVIGGQEMYQAACRGCYLKLHNTVINSPIKEGIAQVNDVVSPQRPCTDATSPLRSCCKNNQSPVC
ncbi:Thymidine kinase, cytosolic [Aphelenchoides bicaudatus]|nr:Thymidine kinase, cytosolic [Aphelenchoides bicaudatus]